MLMDNATCYHPETIQFLEKSALRAPFSTTLAYFNN